LQCPAGLFEFFDGTTWHTAGLVWRLRPNDTEIQLLAHTHKVINQLEEETGIDPG
jgi:sarcosine dehydrogenase